MVHLVVQSDPRVFHDAAMGTIFNLVYSQRISIKKRPVVEFEDPEWTQHLPFMGNITEHLNVLTLKLQARGSLVIHQYDNIRAFDMEPSETKLFASSLTRFLQLKPIPGNLGARTKRNTIR